jgi:hypothetical protein
MSYVIAEGHCYDRQLFSPMQTYWYWLADSSLGQECHSNYFNKVGTAWNVSFFFRICLNFKFNDGNNVVFTLCASRDGSTPYYVLSSADNGHVFYFPV